MTHDFKAEVREYRGRLWSEYRSEYPGSTKFTFNAWLVFKLYWGRRQVMSRTEEYYVKELEALVKKAYSVARERVVVFKVDSPLEREVARELLVECPKLKEIL